jgi:hypothetical protein
LGRDVNLNSYYDFLANSDEDGRVVVVSAEGGTRKIYDANDSDNSKGFLNRIAKIFGGKNNEI